MPTITPPPPRRPKPRSPAAPVSTNTVAKKKTLASALPADWRKALGPELSKPYFKELEKFLAEERTLHTVLPTPEQVL